MNFQLAAIILIIILYPVGFFLAKRKNIPLIGLPVLLLFLASSIYLLVSSWILFLMMLGGGILILFGLAGFSIEAEARRREKLIREMQSLDLDTQGLSRHVPYPILFIDFITVGGGIYLFVLSIIKCLG